MKKKQENIDEILLLKVIENRADDKEMKSFNKWLDGSEENAELFDQLKKTYFLSTFDKHSTKANWQQVINKVKTGYTVPDYIQLPEPKTGQIIRLKPLLHVAAIITLIVGLAFLFQYIVFGPEQLIVAGSDLKNNEPYKLTDGSLVYLHGNSEIAFRNNFGSTNRELTLKGEAFFEVKSNKELPFEITSNNTTTRVLGTSFNVFSDSIGKVKVSVVTGIVEFFVESSTKVKLEAGQQGTYNPKTNGIEKEVIDDPNFQAWKTGVFVFKETPLNQVLELLSGHYSKTLLFVQGNNKMPDITTTFNNQPFEAVLEELNLLLNTKNVFKNDTIYFQIKN